MQYNRSEWIEYPLPSGVALDKIFTTKLFPVPRACDDYSSERDGLLMSVSCRAAVQDVESGR